MQLISQALRGMVQYELCELGNTIEVIAYQMRYHTEYDMQIMLTEH